MEPTLIVSKKTLRVKNFYQHHGFTIFFFLRPISVQFATKLKELPEQKKLRIQIL